MRRVELSDSSPLVLLGGGVWMVLCGLLWRRTDPDIERGSKGMGIFEYRGPSRTPDQWRRRHARGLVSIVRYADDFVMGFESAVDARRMLVDLKERLAKFGLLLHGDQTRLIEFGRLPAMARQQRGALASGDLRLSRLHPRLRVDPGRQVHRQA